MKRPDQLAEPLPWRQPWSSAQFNPLAVDLADALKLLDTAPPDTQRRR